jgi:hypothetical protein
MFVGKEITVVTKSMLENNKWNTKMTYKESVTEDGNEWVHKSTESSAVANSLETSVDHCYVTILRYINSIGGSLVQPSVEEE